MRHNKFFSLIFASLLVITGPVFGNDAAEELKQIESDLKQSQEKSANLAQKSLALQKEMRALRAELISLSQSVQQREANVTRLETIITELAREENLARLALEERHGQSIHTLIALQRLALNPPEAIIALPQPPADMVRSAILLRSIVPQITAQADGLREEVEKYAEKREMLENQRDKLGSASTDLAAEKKRLAALIDTKKDLRARYQKDRKKETRRMASLSRKAKDLRDLLKRLEAESQQRAKSKPVPPRKPQAPQAPEFEEEAEVVLGKPSGGKPITKAKGALQRPASGRVVMRFGQKEELGGKHKGISIKTRKGAQVIATYDGKIAFAGPFRGYRQLLIIDHGDGYHTLLTGMDRIDVSEGQWLLAGEPVGLMSTGASNDATLYFELRKNGAPVNPLPWIRQRNAKAQG